jgi:hypothetical protein
VWSYFGSAHPVNSPLMDEKTMLARTPLQNFIWIKKSAAS